MVNLGLLGVFKYYGFFIDNWIELWTSFGVEMHRSTLKIILPVGISFYTFQTLSYVIDVYRKKLNPTKNFIVFASFVSFFPQLVAGPIERATNLLPQFYKKRIFKYDVAVSGLKLILLGFFKKIVIADNAAILVNEIFANYQNQSSVNLLLGAFYFSFQIYGDFSGYSNIAIGVSRLFGFDLMRNFNYPYFSRNIAEFWRRWHISLSTWFRDYLYIPLGGSRGSRGKQIRNIFIIFLVSGFWHGANWTYLFWGGLHALFFLPLLLTNKNRNYLEIVAKEKKYPSVGEFLKMVSTFLLVTFAWIFFRAENITIAFEYIYLLFINDNHSTPKIGLYTLVLLVFISVEWFSRKTETLQLSNKTVRYLYYFVLIQFILFYATQNREVDFIYFQF